MTRLKVCIYLAKCSFTCHCDVFIFYYKLITGLIHPLIFQSVEVVRLSVIGKSMSISIDNHEDSLQQWSMSSQICSVPVYGCMAQIFFFLSIRLKWFIHTFTPRIDVPITFTSFLFILKLWLLRL